MKNPLRADSSISLGLLLARLPMGAYFLLAGYGKIHGGVEGFVSYAKHNGRIPFNVPPQWVDLYLHAIPYLELAVGLFLVLGVLTRLGAFVGALMVLSFTLAVTGVKSDSLPFQPNLIFMGLLLAVFLVGPGRFSADGFLFKHKRSGAA